MGAATVAAPSELDIHRSGPRPRPPAAADVGQALRCTGISPSMNVTLCPIRFLSTSFCTRLNLGVFWFRDLADGGAGQTRVCQPRPDNELAATSACRTSSHVSWRSPHLTLNRMLSRCCWF